MNKQYIVDENDNVKIITEADKKIDFGKYTIHTDKILSLENFSEETSQKINSLDNRIKEITKKIRNKNKFNRTFNITATIIITILLIISSLITTNIFLLVLTSIIPLSIIIGIVENKILIKDKKEEKYYIQKRNEQTHRLDKIKSKIKILKEDKTPAKLDNINCCIDIKQIENHNIDSIDYFVEKYKLEKRIRETKTEKPKKLVRKIKSNNLYKI